MKVLFDTKDFSNNPMKKNSLNTPVDFMSCSTCNGKVVQNGSRYGCYKAKRRKCENKKLITKEQIQRMILQDLLAKFPLEFENNGYYVTHTSIQNLAFINE